MAAPLFAMVLVVLFVTVRSAPSTGSYQYSKTRPVTRLSHKMQANTGKNIVHSR